MKSSILSLFSFTAAALANTAEATDKTTTSSKQEKLPRILQENPTKTTPIMMDTPYGSVRWGEFISLMEQPHGRQLQTSESGSGFGNDPTACNADGEYFVCDSPNFFTVGGNETKVDYKIRCLLDPAIGFDFQANPSACTCAATLTDSRTRECACSVCPYGRAQAAALDCSVVPDDPFVAGPCTSLDCDGRCNGTGAGVLNQPTPAPADTAPADAPSDSGVSPIGLMMGMVVGTAVSFVSVYWV